MYKKVTFNSLDGIRLVSDFYYTSGNLGALLVHGITSDKTEDGFYVNLAKKLLKYQISSLSIDLRSHGDSEGEQENFYLAGAINDICSGIDYLCNSKKTHILIASASFSGGLSIRAAELRNDLIKGLVLFNPRLDYTPWIKDTNYWVNNKLSNDAISELRKNNFIIRKGFKLGYTMINELLCFDPTKGLATLDIDILFVHGKKDSVVPIETSIANYNLNGRGEIIEIENSEHGFTDYETDDPYSESSKAIRGYVIKKTEDWISNNFLKS